MKELDYQPQINNFVSEMVKHVPEKFNEKGGFPTSFMILCKAPGKDNFPVVVVDLNGAIEEHKDIIAKILPEIIKTLETQKLQPLCTAFCSEAWMRDGSVKGTEFENLDEQELMDSEKFLKYYRSLPKKEGLFLSIETEFSSESYFSEIIRSEDSAVAGPLNTMNVGKSTGRFANLFQKFQFNDN